MMGKYENTILSLFYFTGIIAISKASEKDQVFTQCGGKLRGPHGVIHSPNYPNPFPTPIYCEWVINAPSDKKIILYFTQYYLRGSFDVIEYKYYKDFTTYIDEHKLATVNCEDEIPYIVSFKPYLVIRFAVHEMGNVHMRVLDHIVDVFGFNITYEFADEKDDVKTACSVAYCSYLGNCIASSNYSSYQCDCFPEYFGEECQYGPHCDPPRGENMCFNGGKCRYFFGTYVNTCECPRGYDGSRCEIQTGDLPHYCVSLRCGQKCEREENGGGHCACNEGYRITENNRTCVHIDRYRITVTVTLQSYHEEYLNKNTFDDLKTDVFTKFGDVGITSTDTFGSLGFRSVSGKYEYRFYFYIEKSEMRYLQDAIYYLWSFNKIGNMSIIPTRPKYTTEPELYLVSVSTSASDSDVQAAVQGQILTLSCAARGSQNIKFEWFKDGYVIDTTLTKREVYSSFVTSSSEEMIRSILSLDNVTPYDRGEYTCRASDYGESKNKSVIVDVITLPLVDLDPLSSSVTSGEKVSVRCMSPDDTQKTFLNEWFEGTTKITPGHRKDRIVEDLFPTGTRLFIPSLTHSATFTCRVTNAAGGVNVTSHIYVPETNETNLECPKEYYKQVIWRKTTGKHFDKQRCPTDTGVISLYGPFEVGYTTRRCDCQHGSGKCQWSDPNFARCQSFYLVQIYDELEILTLGYQHITMKTVYDHLEDFLVKNTNYMLYSGDFEIATSIFANFLNHLNNFPILATRDKAIQVKSILNLMDILLSGTMNATEEEKTMMTAGTAFFRMGQSLAMGLSEVLDFTQDKSVSLSNIDMDIKTTYLVEDADLHRYYPRLSKTRTKRHILYEGKKDEDLQVAEFTYRNMLSLLAPLNLDVEPGLIYISSVHSVYPFQNENVTQKEDKPFLVDIPIPHLMKIDKEEINKTLCMAWEFDIRQMHKGRWMKEACNLISFENTYSICRCPIPGHFMVAVKAYNETGPLSKGGDNMSLYFTTGCIIMMCGVVSTFVILLYNWRRLKGDEFAIHLNFLLALIGVNCIFLVCLQNEDNEVICIVGQILAHFLYLAAEAFLFVEAIRVYLSAINKSSTKHKLIKYMGVGWGIPALMTIIVIIASALVGYNNACSKICWVTRDQWQFYGYVVPMIILILLYLLFTCLSLKTCLTWKEEWKISTKHKILKRSATTGVMLVLVIASSLLKTSIHSDDQQGQLIVLVCVDILLATFIFISSVICDRKIFPPFWKRSPVVKRKPEEETNGTLPSSSSFRAFIKPERVETDTTCDETEDVNKYYDEINRIKFTKERKRHLSTLLGSSTSGILMNSIAGSYTFRPHDADNDQNGTDSGIFVGSEHERSDKFLYDESSESGIQVCLPSTSGRIEERQRRLRRFVSDSDDVFEEERHEPFSLHKTNGFVSNGNHRTNGCVIPIVVKPGGSRRHRSSDTNLPEESFALIHSTSDQSNS